MSGSCCQFRDHAPVVEVMPPFTPAHTHDIVFLACHADLQHEADKYVRNLCASHRATPTASPGSGTILRI
ncbi:MAG TPA: hypothetical protein VG844_05190 [Terracidiphilus sp.]|nr:hypothetical protein [Terracidiphilus sp.]